MSGVLVLLNGYPGVGKTSVARELAQRLPNAHVVDLSHLEQIARSVHPEKAQAYEGLVSDLTRTLLNSLQPLPTTPIYLIPHTILASLPHRNRITPFLQLGSKGFHIIHIVLSSSTEVNVARLLSGRRASAGSSSSAGVGGVGDAQGRSVVNGAHGSDGHAERSGNGLSEDQKGGVLGDTMGRITDEASLLELRMEDEVLRLMSGIIGRRASAPESGAASASALTTTASDKPTTIQGLEHHLSAEYEIDTSRLDAALTGMMAAEYVMDVMRRNGVLLGGGRKRSC